MRKLIDGLHRFQTDVYAQRKERFEQLAGGQSPETLFITCSDSRIDPNLLTQTEPGELFILRNAGNIVPPYGAAGAGGEGATIEYAVEALGVREIIVCGHSHCGAMKGLLDPESLANLPMVATWLAQAEATRRIVLSRSGVDGDRTDPAELLNFAIEQNVLVQLENLRTNPAVASALARGKVELYGWVYRIETGEVLSYDREAAKFLPLGGTVAAS